MNNDILLYLRARTLNYMAAGIFWWEWGVNN